MSTPKATHRFRYGHAIQYFDVGTVRDSSGMVAAKYACSNGDWLHVAVLDTALEPIPAPTLIPHDYESWFALLREHKGNVWVKSSNRLSLHTSTACQFTDAKILGSTWADAVSTCEYSTDYGATWHPVAREAK